MTIQIQDETFGLVTQNSNCDWEFNHSSTLLGEDACITVEGSEANRGDRPSQDMYKAFEWFRDHQLAIKSLSEATIFEHYKKVFNQYRKGWGGKAEQRVPKINNKNEIWSLIQNPTVWFYCDYADFSIHWAAMWDSEHGVTLFFKDGKVIGVE